MTANKVRFGLKNVHYAIITGYDDDGVAQYDTPKAFPGAVALSLDPSGEVSNFYADDIVYYVLNNVSGFEGTLEMAIITKQVATDLLGEVIDKNGFLVQTTTAELAHFALMFEFTGDKTPIRHCILNCTASRSTLEGSTIEEDKEVQTETLSLTASALANGVVKYKTTEATTTTAYNNFYDAVVIPSGKLSTSISIDIDVEESSDGTSAVVTLTADPSDATITYDWGGNGYLHYSDPFTVTTDGTLVVNAMKNGYPAKSVSKYINLSGVDNSTTTTSED